MATHRKLSPRSPARNARSAPATPPRAVAAKRPAAPANEAGPSGRAVWAGSIGFGLVQVPVRLYTRERANDLSFHQVDRRDHAAIAYERVNRDTGKRVEWADIARAYELQKGQMVVVDDADFEKASVTASRTIEIQDFVAATAIEPAYFDRPYFLLPDKRGEKAYAVLRDVLASKQLAAVALVVLRTRQHLCSVTAEGELLALELLRFAHELRPQREVLPRGASPSKVAKPNAKELALAEQLIERMVVDWDPSSYKDTYRDELLAAIRRKAETGVLEPQHVPEVQKGPIDLVELLRRSVAGAKKKKKRGKRKAA